jgi:hypothetical protein
MAERFDSMDERIQEFIKQQKIFFVGTAAQEGSVNVSPKGMESLRVLNPNQVVWLNLTGSGNETAAHLLQANRITLMFCAFEGPPLILRLYGSAEILHEDDDLWQEYRSLFPGYHGARQIISVKIELVQTSCGFGVPNYDYVGDRDTLNKWAEKRGEAGIREYWREKNRLSLDGFTTDIT